MIYGSVCSGIEAASAAWAPLGWRPAWFSEVDPYCCELLRQRYGGVVNLGDIRNVGKEHGPVGLLVGGTPCQDFSVNGARDGLAGDRGRVTSEYLRVVQALRPAWVVWENVPGVLTVNGGLAFGGLLRSLAGCGYGVAWRVLDLRGFGVPQQRRRLFLVGRSGGRTLLAAGALFDAPAGGEHAGPLPPLHGDGPAPPAGDAWPAGWTGDPTPKCSPRHALTLRSGQGGEGAGVGWPGRARRFTPREWERLFGFPDDYTAVTVGGRPASDSQRRRALGNTFPVPVLHWIGSRIDYLHSLEKRHEEEKRAEATGCA